MSRFLVLLMGLAWTGCAGDPKCGDGDTRCDVNDDSGTVDTQTNLTDPITTDTAPTADPTPTALTGDTAMATADTSTTPTDPWPAPVIDEAAPLVCTGPNLELAVTVSGVTDGAALMYMADIANAGAFGEEHVLFWDESLDTPGTETLTLTLQAGAGVNELAANVNTIFACETHLSGNEDSVAAVYSVYDIDGNFSDCAGDGGLWEDLLATNAATYGVPEPSNLAQLVNCHAL